LSTSCQYDNLDAVRCPACQKPVDETSPACPQCHLSHAAIDRALGVPPAIAQTVVDLADCLTRSQTRRIMAELEALEMRFPQVRMNFITCNPPPNMPLQLYLFWVFNHNRTVSAVERGGENHLVMVAVNPVTKAAACMVGYGLEPFVSQELLHQALEAARPALVAADYVAAVKGLSASLSQSFTTVCEAAPHIYGLEGEVITSPDQLDPNSSGHLALAY
jgi:uncharacterized membrane protein YgcG